MQNYKTSRVKLFVLILVEIFEKSEKYILVIFSIYSNYFNFLKIIYSISESKFKLNINKSTD